MRDFFNPGRSPVCGLAAAVASSHPLASAAAFAALVEGGNAMDAAVTASFVLCVVEPQSTGLGGDCFALYCAPGMERPAAYNGSGRAPADLDAASARAAGGAPLAETSVHAVTVPGAVEGLSRLLLAHGTWPLDRAIEPAAAYAENGFVIHQRVADEWASAAAKLALRPPSRAGLLRNGRAPSAGEIWRSPALASTLRAIAAGGAEAFYRGEIAQRLARCLSEAGGYHCRRDFADHRGEAVAAISTSYRGYDVWQVPPNGQGATALMMLNILENFDLSGLPFDGAARHDLVASATRLAFGERDRLIADPLCGPVPLDVFLDKAHARQLARSIGGCEAKASAMAPPARGDTAYVSVVDAQRNAVSLISSLFEGFGSGIYDPGTGIVFHNRGSGFSAEAGGHPNALAPARRPLHTIIPGMVTREGRAVLSFGVTGGPYQPVGHTQLITGMIDHGLDIQEAIDRPRSLLRDGKLQLEPGLAGIAAALEACGHEVVEAQGPIGGGHGIWIDWDAGTLAGGADPRKDGCAIAM